MKIINLPWIFQIMNLYKKLNFYQKNSYYVTSLNCKLRLKEYIHEDEKIKKLSAKSRLLLEKGAAYLCDIDYLMLTSEWYMKDSNHTYRFKLYPKIIDNYSYKYKFWDKIEKKLGMDIFSFCWKRF